MIDKLDLKTPDIVNENITKVAELFPNCITETDQGKAIDFDLLKQELNHEVIEGNKERYRLEWPGKKEAIVTANLPTTNTLRPVPEDSVDFENTENLYIEGDNLEVLKILQESYLGKIKMIYIDPPYNTGKDFVYKDNFAVDKTEHEVESGQRDEIGNRLVANSESSGRYHSDWLSMMYPRLKLARNLLTDDGMIFISIDDREVSNLRKMCDEIFGEINSLDRGSLIWINKGSTKGFNKIVKNHEYIIAYAKKSESVRSVYAQNYPDNLPDIVERLQIKRSPKNPVASVKFPKGLRIEGIDNISFSNNINPGTNQLDIENGPMIFENGFLKDDVILSASFPYKNQMIEFFNKINTKEKTVDYKGQEWKEVYFTKTGVPYFIKKRSVKVISSVIDNVSNSGFNDLEKLDLSTCFNNPKPVDLLEKFISYFACSDDTILDFYAGSSTTAHATMSLNCKTKNNLKFIMIQLPEVTDENSEAYKAGYKNICEIGKERIRRAGKKILSEQKEKEPSLLQNENSELNVNNSKLDIGFRVYRLDSSNMKDVYYRPQDYKQEQMDYLTDNLKDNRSSMDLLTQVMLDWGLPLSLEIKELSISNKQVFQVAGNSLLACFDDGVDENFTKDIAKYKPLRLVCRDKSFTDDTTKENVKQLLKQLSPETEFKVI
ncbi:MAG: site-specific DNA-methyltransferase [Candidatus Tenebribacter davisii]|nr:site-specific DNA-methyltransferase [Candidatus Tenebribacter davisii]